MTRVMIQAAESNEDDKRERCSDDLGPYACYSKCRVMTTIYGDHGVSMSKRYNGSYTASLSSMLTAQRLEPAVKDVATLKKMNATVGYFQGSFLRSYIIGMLGFGPAKVRKYPSTAAGYAKALNTK
ncbi:hypothetical protein AgCh_026553 [Apium graveolens]